MESGEGNNANGCFNRGCFLSGGFFFFNGMFSFNGDVFFSNGDAFLSFSHGGDVFKWCTLANKFVI